MPRLALAAAVVALPLLLTGCAASGDTDGGLRPDPTAAASDPAPASPDSGAAGTVPSGGPQPTDVTASPGTIRFADAAEAVGRLLQARIDDDKPGALLAAGPNTVAKVWALPAPASAEVGGCQTGEEAGSPAYAFDCYQQYDGGSSHFLVNAHPASGWRVENFRQTAD